MALDSTLPSGMQKAMDALKAEGEGIEEPAPAAPEEPAAPAPGTAPAPAVAQDPPPVVVPVTAPAPALPPPPVIPATPEGASDPATAGRLRQVQADVTAKDLRIEELQRELASRPAQGAEPLPAPSPAPTPAAELTDAEIEEVVSEELIEEFGHDYFRVQAKLARRFAPPPPPTDDRVDRLEQRVESTARQALFGELDQLVPNWRDVNASDGFMAWKQTIEPLTGEPYGLLLRDALSDGDAYRARGIYAAYGASLPADLVASQVMPPPGGGGQGPSAEPVQISYQEFEKRLLAANGSGGSLAVRTARIEELNEMMRNGQVDMGEPMSAGG